MLKFSATFGIMAGYGHDNSNVSADPAETVGAAWQAALEEEFSSSSILVGATVTPTRVVYPTTFGCPHGGEIAATVAGDANPAFVGGEGQPSLDQFVEATLRVVSKTKDTLRQERVQVTFTGDDGARGFAYLEPEGVVRRWGFIAQ